MTEKREGSLFCKHKSSGYATMVREFYSNIVEKKEKTCYVRGKWVSFERDEIKKNS